jgi:DNA-binding transcriptional MocR family regulator
MSHRTPLATAVQAGGYTRVPNILRTLGLTPREEQLVNRLLECRRDDRAPWPSVKTLAGRMNGCSVRTVQRAIKGLEDRGLLVVEYRYRADGSQMSSVYHLAPVLTPVRDAPATMPRDDRHQGVTRMAGKEEYPGKNTKRSSATGAGYDVAAYLAHEQATYREGGARYPRR